jgi:hypothetical protein
MDEQAPGYQTILSQLIAAVAGRGAFYYVAVTSIFVVLTFSAQTSFADFPRVCRLLAEDNFLPHVFADRGRRLVFSHGIVILAILSGAVLIAFQGVTEALIPLFAVGAFSAFVFSQLGMVVHWWRLPGPGSRLKLFLNALGATTTTLALCVIVIAKFIEGAWVVVLVIPALFLLLMRIRKHYETVALEVGYPMVLQAKQPRRPVVIIPISGWNRITEKAVRCGLLMSDRVIAVHVVTDETDRERLKKIWQEKVTDPAEEAGYTAPTLEIIASPYRLVCEPILDFVGRVQRERPDELFVVMIPELIEPHWYEYVLHNLAAAKLRALLYMRGNKDILIVSVPWHVRTP